jgi:hypothetical protein
MSDLMHDQIIVEWSEVEPCDYHELEKHPAFTYERNGISHHFIPTGTLLKMSDGDILLSGDFAGSGVSDPSYDYLSICDNGVRIVAFSMSLVDLVTRAKTPDIEITPLSEETALSMGFRKMPPDDAIDVPADLNMDDLEAEVRKQMQKG